MFNIEFFFKGLLIGIIVSAPLGPVGILCVQRTVNRGQVFGFLSGLGAATADTFYAFLAAFGVKFLTSFLSKNQTWFQIIGAGVLIFLGVKMIFANPIKQYRSLKSSGGKGKVIKDYLSVFFLTLSNPLTIVFFGAAFTMLGLLTDTTNIASVNNKAILILGVFSGAVFWWFALSNVVNIFRKRFRLRSIFMLNRISGFVIIILSFALVFKVFFLHNL